MGNLYLKFVRPQTLPLWVHILTNGSIPKYHVTWFSFELGKLVSSNPRAITRLDLHKLPKFTVTNTTYNSFGNIFFKLAHAMGTKKEYTSDFKITFCAITDASFVSTLGAWSNRPMASFLYITWVRWVLAWGQDCLSGFTTRGQVILDFYVLLTDVCQQTITVSTFFDRNWKKLRMSSYTEIAHLRCEYVLTT